MIELWLVVIVNIVGFQPATRISGERHIHQTVEGCARERDYLVEYMRRSGFEVTAECQKFRVVD